MSSDACESCGLPAARQETKKDWQLISHHDSCAGTPEAVSAANAPCSHHAGKHHPKRARH